ncbi:hypothetical protein M406DRAFT_66226 [Cryphonectria parasitica EP155]|uniref:Uncharacterized protein n=1 Tax=Cryphonectria parasitica (strain ATCC 38755 / EP155) TaxID=660469 RepID=A0A9P4YAE0_CRYP1|nr:uncharacterized protein M406DRAFT_66226 [Cryphonectria parasitica EP155]KAF3769753.1 hypothetical protein M406DRAFT_66226 [Cryphonectria parasitica EP155]
MSVLQQPVKMRRKKWEDKRLEGVRNNRRVFWKDVLYSQDATSQVDRRSTVQADLEKDGGRHDDNSTAYQPTARLRLFVEQGNLRVLNPLCNEREGESYRMARDRTAATRLALGEGGELSVTLQVMYRLKIGLRLDRMYRQHRLREREGEGLLICNIPEEASTCASSGIAGKELSEPPGLFELALSAQIHYNHGTVVVSSWYRPGLFARKRGRRAKAGAKGKSQAAALQYFSQPPMPTGQAVELLLDVALRCICRGPLQQQQLKRQRRSSANHRLDGWVYLRRTGRDRVAILSTENRRGEKKISSEDSRIYKTLQHQQNR